MSYRYKCKNCGVETKYFWGNWCGPCQLSNFKTNFKNWTSGNKKIDNLIQEMQLKISSYKDIVFEWIPYNQFDNVEIINKGDFATVYSAIWKDGPLYYDDDDYINYDEDTDDDDDDDDYYKYTRKPDKKVTLKCLHNSQNITSEFLNEV